MDDRIRFAGQLALEVAGRERAVAQQRAGTLRVEQRTLVERERVRDPIAVRRELGEIAPRVGRRAGVAALPRDVGGLAQRRGGAFSRTGIARARDSPQQLARGRELRRLVACVGDALEVRQAFAHETQRGRAEADGGPQRISYSCHEPRRTKRWGNRCFTAVRRRPQRGSQGGRARRDPRRARGRNPTTRGAPRRIATRCRTLRTAAGIFAPLRRRA